MKHPPYHLRTNKVVDRLLLADVIRALGPNYREFTYYSLAGPFLEDLRVIDHFLPEIRLVSLESNEQTYKRQMFHKFSRRLDLRKRTLADFLAHDYEPGVRDIFWLDYTDLKYARFGEFQAVLNQVPDGSVVRITLRAEPELDLELLRDRLTDEEMTRMQQQLQKNFVDEFHRVLSHPIPNAFGTPKEFAILVQHMVRRAASTALDTPGSDRDFLPVQSTRYNDHTQMLSVTGIVVQRNLMDAMREQLKEVRFVDFEWSEPTQINIPALSVKERLRIEHHLPVEIGEDAGEVLYKALEYMIDEGAKATKRQLGQYADCYREYPHFIRLSF